MPIDFQIRILLQIHLRRLQLQPCPRHPLSDEYATICVVFKIAISRSNIQCFLFRSIVILHMAYGVKEGTRKWRAQTSSTFVKPQTHCTNEMLHVNWCFALNAFLVLLFLIVSHIINARDREGNVQLNVLRILKCGAILNQTHAWRDAFIL